jgi:hypothetical protein
LHNAYEIEHLKRADDSMKEKIKELQFALTTLTHEKELQDKQLADHV